MLYIVKKRIKIKTNWWELKFTKKTYQVLLDIAFMCINVPLDKGHGAIQSALEKVGRLLYADRGYVFNYDFMKQIAVNTHEWCNNGIKPQIENLQASPMEAAPDWVASHLNGNPVVIGDISKLAAGEMRNILEHQGIKSLITVPIFYSEKLYGFIGFDSVNNKQTYSNDDVDLIQFLGEIIINVKMRIHSDEKLTKANEALEQKVKERTSELEELNTALKVLLKKRDFDKKAIQENIYSNYKSLLKPLIKQLRINSISDNQVEILNILDNSIDEILSPFSKKISHPMVNLTPTEILVAKLVKQGNTNKEISELLIKSVRAVAAHRENIRSKLGLKNKKVNLQTYLLSID